MRRITKIGSIALALLLTVPAILSLDLFGGVEAQEGPLLYSVDLLDPVTHTAYAEMPLTDGLHTYAYAEEFGPGDGGLTIRDRSPGGIALFTWYGGAVHGLATDRTGAAYVAGTSDGQVVYITSENDPYDTERVFETGSPVMDVTMDPSGHWFAAVTYHGDVYLFQKARFLETGGFVWRHKAPMPAGATPVNPDLLPNEARDGEAQLLGKVTARPYNHVTFAGSAKPGNPNGLYIAAGTAFGEVWVFDAAQGTGPAGPSGLRPETYHVGDGQCQALSTNPHIEAPCTREASERFVKQLDSLTGGVAHPAFTQVAETLGRLTALDPVTAIVPLQTQTGLLAVRATTGAPVGGGHLVAAATADGGLHVLQVRSATGAPGSDGRSVVRPLWALDGLGPIGDIDLAPFDLDADEPRARLALAGLDGKVRTYNVAPAETEAPAPELVTSTASGGATHVSLSRGGTPNDPHGGRYLAFTTESLQIRLLDARASAQDGAAVELWRHDVPAFAEINDLHVSPTASVLVASHGLALYGGYPAVSIDAPDTGKKQEAWKAQADAFAPDSPIGTYAWTLTREEGGTPATYTGAEITHTFSEEGTYRVGLTVTDQRGFSAHAEKTVDVGGLRPKLNFTGPSRASIGETVVWNFTGTHDPDAADGLGIKQILLYPYGSGTPLNVSLETLHEEVVYDAIGEYRVRAVAYDHDGRSTDATRRITINDGGWCVPQDQVGGTGDGCSDPEPPGEDNGTDGGDGSDGNTTDPGDGGNTTDPGDGGNTTDPSDPTNSAPTAAFDTRVTGFSVRVDAATSSDPDGDALTYTWRFGDGTRAHGVTANHVYTVAGSYRITLTVTDGRGGTATATRDVTIQTCAPETLPTTTTLIRYLGITVARSSGTTLSYDATGQHAGQFDIRGPNAQLLYREPPGGPAVFTAALSADGCHAYLGRADGSLLYVSVSDPNDRHEVKLFGDTTRVNFLLVSDSGKHAVAATNSGEIRILSDHLTQYVHNTTIDGRIVRMVADRSLLNLVAQTEDGDIHVLDGQGVKRDLHETHTPTGTVTALALTPNTDGAGRAWLFLGKDEGTVDIIKIQGHRLYPLGTTAVSEYLPVQKMVAGPMDAHGQYVLGILATTPQSPCRAGTERPCGEIAIIDSRGPYDGNVPMVRKSSELTKQARNMVMTPEGRQMLVIENNRDAVLRYDAIWKEGALQRLSGFPSLIYGTVMADNGNAYALLDDGRIVWFYAPPLADFRIGPHDETGTPLWGARVTAQRETTFDPSITRPGVGRLVSYQWDFGDGTTSDDPLPVHVYKQQGRYAIQLSVTSRVEGARETLLVDRYKTVINVYDPPPVAILKASPYDSTTKSVNITSGESVRFDGSSSYDPGSGRIIHYHYAFGDGQSWSGTSSVRSHLYGRGGTFYATLTVTDDQGFKSQSNKIKVNVANRAPSAGFAWDQPDTNETGGWVTYGVPVHFDASASHDPDGQIHTYEWTFPDGITKTGKTVSHTFPTTGSASVVLRVRDNAGTWSLPASATITVDDGIRLRHTQDPADGHTIDPTQEVRAHGFVHDHSAWPAAGQGIPDVKVIAKVYYDGPLGSRPASSPYDTKTHLTDSAGKIVHTVAFNQGLAFQPGKYRIQLTAVMEGSLNGDTEYSQTTETHFVVT